MTSQRNRWRFTFILAVFVFLVRQWSTLHLVHELYEDDSPSFLPPPPIKNPQKEYYLSLPKWMTDYFQWHTDQLNSLKSDEKSSWIQHRLLILRCMDDDRCGGTSDRIKSLPVFLALAAKSKRLLFLKWNRPFPLEQFLIPRQYWNWSVPSSLSRLLDNNAKSPLYNQTTILSKKSKQLSNAVLNEQKWLVQGNLQFSGAELYNELAVELDPIQKQPDYVSLYHSFFHTTFAPVPAVETRVKQIFQEQRLAPNKFVVAHIRAKYFGEPFRETGNLTALQEIVDNAICIAASKQVEKNKVVYLATDAQVALDAATQSKYNQTVRIVSRLGITAERDSVPEDPPHLNFAQRDDPSAFYSIFVDLMVMSQSECVVFGAGGFGRFGSLLSFNASCRQAHSIKGIPQECHVSF